MIGAVPPAAICGRFPDESREAYDATTCLGHSKLSTYIANPRMFYDMHVIKSVPQRSGEALDLGIAIHALVLEGEAAYAQQVTVGGPTNPKTGRTYGRDTKAFAEWLETQPNGRVYLDDSQDRLIRDMARAVGENRIASELLFNCCHRETTYRPAGGLHGLGVQCRTDAESDEPLMLDLKSCQNIATFLRHFEDHGYHRQAAAYRMMRSMVTGESEEDIHFNFIAVAREYPHEVGVFDVDSDLLERGRAEFLRAVVGVRHSLNNNLWPRDRDVVTTIKGKPWR